MGAGHRGSSELSADESSAPGKGSAGLLVAAGSCLVQLPRVALSWKVAPGRRYCSCPAAFLARQEASQQASPVLLLLLLLLAVVFILQAARERESCVAPASPSLDFV